MTYFPEHLRYLCQRYPSISEVARQLGINRSQFMRYLMGKSAPSAHNMRRICELFSVNVSDFNLVPTEFVQRYPISLHGLTGYNQAVQHLALRRYIGWYFDYALSSFETGKISKSLIRVWQEDGQTHYLQILRVPSLRTAKAVHLMERGQVSLEGGKLRFVCHSQPDNSLGQTLITPSLPLRQNYCFGIRLATCHTPLKGPYATRVTLEYLGTDINFRFIYRQLGVFDYGAKLLGGVSQTLKNDYAQGEWRLRTY